MPNERPDTDLWTKEKVSGFWPSVEVISYKREN